MILRQGQAPRALRRRDLPHLAYVLHGEGLVVVERGMGCCGRIGRAGHRRSHRTGIGGSSPRASSVRSRTPSGTHSRAVRRSSCVTCGEYRGRPS